MIKKRSLALIATLLAAFLISVPICPTCADEFIIDDQSHSTFDAGDFTLAPCQHHINALQINPETTEVSAGELWKYFNEQGLTKVDTIKVCVNASDSAPVDIDFRELAFFLVDSGDKELQSFNLDKDQDNSMLVPGYGVTNYKPEAEIKIALGYDFMERFSESSTEKFVVNFKVDNAAGATPVFSVAGSETWRSPLDFSILIGFLIFWAVVFLLMFKYFKPTPTRPKSHSPVSA